MTKSFDVIIAGAGPIGLFLACELGLARVSVLVLERDLNRESPWKVKPLGLRGLNTLSVEHFYRRGLLYKLFDPSERPSYLEKKPGFQFGGHFAGIAFNANKLELDRFKYRLPGPALVPAATYLDKVEAVLTARAESLGVTFVRGNGVTKIISQNDDSITVEAGENQTFCGKWLVGCDGGRSAVRKLAGFDFVGTEAKFSGYAVKCDWEPMERLTPGFHVTKNGLYIIMPGPPGYAGGALYMTDFDGGAFDRTQEITESHVQSVLHRISGLKDVKITKVHLGSAFTDRCKQTTSYRKGRVLLAGDAAHIHGPVGSQGLNLGFGDAMNLGWKLAATLRQKSSPDGVSPADLTLLDTYESERHPIGEWVLNWTRAQVATLQPDPHSAAMQAIVRDLIATTDGTNFMMDRHWGLSQRYKLREGDAHAHPLVGSSAPDFEFEDGSRLGPLLEAGKGLLVDFGDQTELKQLIVSGKYEAKVEYVGMGAKNTCGLQALLLRPDGIVAWVVEGPAEPDIEAAKVALERWFGT